MANLPPDAARLPVPKSVTLKRPQDFKLIGTPARRLDTAGKVNGTAVYGIDVRPPGVKIATLAQSPVFGGRVKRVNDAASCGSTTLSLWWPTTWGPRRKGSRPW